jgi:hypothetical protein
MSYQGQLSGPLGQRQTEARNARKANESMAWTQRENVSTMYAKQQDQKYCKELESLINEYYGNDEDIQKIKNMNPNNWSCQEILEELNQLLDSKKMGGKIRRHKKKSNRRTKKSRRRQRKQTRRR